MLRRAGAAAVRSAAWLEANSPDFTWPNGGGTGEASESPLNQARRLFSGSRGLSHLTRQGDGARCLSDLGVPVCGASRRRQVVRGVSVQRWPDGGRRGRGERDLSAERDDDTETERPRTGVGVSRPMVLRTML